MKENLLNGDFKKLLEKLEMCNKDINALKEQVKATQKEINNLKDMLDKKDSDTSTQQIIREYLYGE